MSSRARSCCVRRCRGDHVRPTARGAAFELQEKCASRSARQSAAYTSPALTRFSTWMLQAARLRVFDVETTSRDVTQAPWSRSSPSIGRWQITDSGHLSTRHAIVGAAAWPTDADVNDGATPPTGKDVPGLALMPSRRPQGLRIASLRCLHSSTWRPVDPSNAFPGREAHLTRFEVGRPGDSSARVEPITLSPDSESRRAADPLGNACRRDRRRQ